MKRTLVFLSLIAVLLLVACGGTPSPTAAPPTTAPQTQPTTATQPTATTAAPTTAATTAAPTAVPPPTATPIATVPAAANATHITFWSWVPTIQEQVNEWNQTHPDIYVDYLNAGAGNANYTKLNTAIQAGTGLPDVVQIEYQHLPNYIVKGVLLDLSQYGANDVKSQFVPWTWAQVSQGTGVYAYPQDAGPMVMFCNNAILTKYNIPVPQTWDDFQKAAADLHKADPNVYLTNFTADQGWFFGMLWQSGAQPFKVNGQNLNINFTSPEVTRVAQLWDNMMKAGVLSPVDTYTNDWNTALGKGVIACWQAGSWGTYISSYGPDFKGKWQVYLMPQWTAGGKVNGNYGGSTDAVMKATQHPKEAAAFAQWLNTDAKPTLEFTNPDKAGLFPVTQTTLSNKQWSDVTYDYWSGKAIHQTMAQAAQEVDPSFQWSPITDYVYTTYADLLTQVKSGSITLVQAMKTLQDKSVSYAKDQGFTVTTQ